MILSSLKRPSHDVFNWVGIFSRFRVVVEKTPVGEWFCAICGMAQNFKLRHLRNGTIPLLARDHIYPASYISRICFFSFFLLRHLRNGTKFQIAPDLDLSFVKSDFLVNSFRVSDGRKSDFSRLGPQFSISDGLFVSPSELASRPKNPIFRN